MKASELRPCDLCGRGLMHDGVPLLWRVRLERLGIDRRAVQQAAAMELHFGGAVRLARMFADPEVAISVGEARTILVCEACAGETTSVYRLGLPEDRGES